MQDLINSYLSSRLSRRDFSKALAGIGISMSGVSSIVQSAEAVLGPVNASGPFKITGTGGDLVVAQMKAAGSKYLFTNPGSFEVGFFDSFLDEPGVNLIMGLHEGIVISMADGYHKVTGNPAFVNVHVIAGTAQSLGQLYNAHRDGSSLVVTAGLLDNELGDDEVLLAPRPGFNQKDITRQFTKISWEARDAGGLPAMIRRAFKVATTSPGAPVYLGVPNYVFEEKNVTAEIFDHSAFMIPNDIRPNADDIEYLTSKLLEAKSPGIFLGDDAWKAGAQSEIFELAELLRIPVSENNLSSHKTFPTHHSLHVGGYGAQTGRDLILSIGTRDLGGGNFAAAPRPISGGSEFYIGLNPASVVSDRPYDRVIMANAKLATRALIDNLKAAATKERLSKITSDRTTPSKKSPKPGNSLMGGSPIQPAELAWTMNEELDANAIIVSENLSGANNYFDLGFREDEKMWVGNSGAGLGWGVGAASGAKLGQPDRQVVCNIGDGSVMYSASGFWTQARYEIPVLTVVCNNHNYQTVRNAYARYDGKMKKSNKFTGMYLGDPEIDFVKLAQSQGVDGIKVTESSQLRSALQRGIAATREGRPFLIDVVVSRTGAGAESTWYQKHSVAGLRTKKV